MCPAASGPNLVADLTRMRSGAIQLARLADELASMVAHAAALSLPEPGLAARRDQLVGSLGHRVITLAVLAERVRRDADVLTAAEDRAERAFLGVARALDPGTRRARAADGR